VGRAAAGAVNEIAAEHRPAIANDQRGTEAWIAEIRKHLRERRFDRAREELAALSLRASQFPGMLNTHQSAWINRNRWSSSVRHGLVCLRRCNSDGEGFFRSTYTNSDFTRRFNRQTPWSGNLSRALGRYGEDPPALLGMLQWVVCLRDIPIGLISLSNIDYSNIKEGFLTDHFKFPGQGFASVHVLGLTRRQAVENPRLVNAIRRRIGADWLKQTRQHLR
jgi:hypothetical protein